MAKSNEARLAAAYAQMEGEAVVVRNIGNMMQVSEMELAILCNLAHLACLRELLDESNDPDTQRAGEAEIKDFRRDIDTMFAAHSISGVRRFVQSCIGILYSDRFTKYIVKEAENGKD